MNYQLLGENIQIIRKHKKNETTGACRRYWYQLAESFQD